MVTTRKREYKTPTKTPTKRPQATTPAPAKVSEGSETPGESSVRTWESRSHIWPVLADDIEASGGLKLYLKTEQALDKLLKRLCDEDKTGIKIELYSGKARDTIRRKVYDWKRAYKQGTYYNKVLKDLGVIPFENRKQVQFPSDLDSSIATEDYKDDNNSIASSRKPSINYTKKKLKSPPTQEKPKGQAAAAAKKQCAENPIEKETNPVLPVHIQFNRLKLDSEPDKKTQHKNEMFFNFKLDSIAFDLPEGFTLPKKMSKYIGADDYCYSYYSKDKLL